MKVIEVTEEYILFDNGNTLTYDHDQDCCEHNYADFLSVKEEILDMHFEEDLIFEMVDNAGFRFGSNPLQMIFIPCYSEQNGYYTQEIDIYYKKHIISLNAKFKDDYYD